MVTIIQHKDAVDPYIHEPKDIERAESGDVYVADGEGSGEWTPLSDLDTDGERIEYLFCALNVNQADYHVFQLDRDAYVDKAWISIYHSKAPSTDYSITFQKITTTGTVDLAEVAFDGGFSLVEDPLAYTIDNYVPEEATYHLSTSIVDFDSSLYDLGFGTTADTYILKVTYNDEATWADSTLGAWYPMIGITIRLVFQEDSANWS